jgi:Putative transposase
MAQTAAHMVECVMPWVPTRQWVVSVPIPLRYWTAPSRDLTAQVHTILRTSIAPFYVNQAVKHGAERHKIQAGSVTFLQRFGEALQLNLHYHLIAIEGVFVDRIDQGRKPRFVKVELPTQRGRKTAHCTLTEDKTILRSIRSMSGQKFLINSQQDTLRGYYAGKNS